MIKHEIKQTTNLDEFAKILDKDGNESGVFATQTSIVSSNGILVYTAIFYKHG